MPTVYATPSDLWDLVLNPETLFQDPGLEPGNWSPIVKTGAGTGSITLYYKSNPRDAFTVFVDCVVGGELNVDGIVNPGALPQFAISLDGGLTFSAAYIAENNGLLSYLRGGFTLQLQNGVAAPSFVAGDRWTFTTQASPIVTQHLLAACRTADMYLGNTYKVPPIQWAEDLKLIVCELAKWSLLKRRGLAKGQDLMVYEPKEAMERLMMIAKGEIQPEITESEAPYVFPMIIIPRKKYATDWSF